MRLLVLSVGLAFIVCGKLSFSHCKQQALLAAEILEKAAQIAVICAGTGNKVYELSFEDVDVMHDFYEKHYSKRQQGED